MIHYTSRVIEIFAILGTVSSMGYYSLCLWGAARFLRERNSAGTSTPVTPPVSLLKPLKGTDPGLYENLRSHCLQDYPEYEIIFGVSDPTDPAIALVERLKSEFPRRAMHLLVCRANLGANTKVSNLAQMLREARYEYLIVNDSDIRVAPDYLRRVVAPLADPKTGMVTCLYRGVPSTSVGSHLEAIGINTDFCGGVLAARQIEGGMHFALGSTLAFRRRELEAIGGFEGFVDYLADDYEMGNQIAMRGWQVKLIEALVETYLPPYSLREFLDHQLRWARGVRDSRRWGYLGVGLTFGLPWALLVLALAHGGLWVWELVGAAAAMRLVVAVTLDRRVLKGRQWPLWLPLVPLRDSIAVLIWVASFMGHRVEWRGDSFTLKDGKLARIES